MFVFEVFKTHYQTCQQDIMKMSIEKWSEGVADKFKIKILKGLLNKDELGKPYIEYITEISYNSQNWRVNKKFNQFANLHKSLKNTFPDLKFPESASMFSKIVEGSNNNPHESKIKQLEKYLKDISEIPQINKSKQFRKFLDFEEYYDESGEVNEKVQYGESINENEDSMMVQDTEREITEKNEEKTPDGKKKLALISIFI
jgi:hypothetical protein